MREIRMYGSEGGVVQLNALSLPLSHRVVSARQGAAIDKQVYAVTALYSSRIDYRSSTSLTLAHRA